jgi:hypothetical protein
MNIEEMEQKGGVQEAEKKLVVQRSIGEEEHSPRSSPSSPESHQAGKEASSVSPTMASFSSLRS